YSGPVCNTVSSAVQHVLNRKLNGAKPKDVVAHVVTRVVRARGKCKAVRTEELLDKNTSAKVFALAVLSAKVVTGHADLANPRNDFRRAQQSVALGALDVHLHESNVQESLLLADLRERGSRYLDS